jgi:hypothetical protein
MTERFDVLAPRRDRARDQLDRVFVFDEGATHLGTPGSGKARRFSKALVDARKEPSPIGPIGHSGDDVEEVDRRE